MARRLKRDVHGRFQRAGRSVESNPIFANPDLFGEDLETAAGVVLGMGLSGMLSDKLVGPAIKQNVPFSQEGMGKAVDAGTTVAAGILGGWLVGMLSPKWGRLVRRGGIYLGTAKIISIPFSDFSLSATFPMLPYFPSWPSSVAPAASTPAIAAPSGASTSLSSLGVGSTGL